MRPHSARPHKKGPPTPALGPKREVHHLPRMGVPPRGLTRAGIAGLLSYWNVIETASEKFEVETTKKSRYQHWKLKV